jgi:hypothetical protein
MIDYAEITLRTDEDRERLREMTRGGWRVVTTATKEGIVTYYLDRVPTIGPKEDKEHTRAWGHR